MVLRMQAQHSSPMSITGNDSSGNCPPCGCCHHLQNSLNRPHCTAQPSPTPRTLASPGLTIHFQKSLCAQQPTGLLRVRGTWRISCIRVEQGGNGLAPQVWRPGLALLHLSPLQQLLVLPPAGAALNLRICVNILPELLDLCLLLPVSPGKLLPPLVQPLAPGLSICASPNDIGWEQLWGWSRQEGVATI